MTHKNNEKMLTAIFRDRVSTERAFDWLLGREYEPSEISVLMAEKTRASYRDHGTEGQIKSGTHATEGVAAGGAVGATVGAILAIGTSIAIPGLGLIVAGPIVAGLAGGGAGAVAGGTIGGLVGLGIPESNAKA